jgi:HlyD family secretion protein
MVFRVFIAAVVVAVAVAGGYWYVQAPAVAVIRPDTGSITQRLVATGRVSSNQRINLGALMVGTVVAVEVDEGDGVQQEQPMVLLDDAEAQAGVRLAQASLVQAQARLGQLSQVGQPEAAMNAVEAETNLNHARREMERAQQLRLDGFMSEFDWEARQDSVELAEARRLNARQVVQSRQVGGSEYRLLAAQVGAAQASLDQSRAVLSHTRLAAPINGRVVQRSVETGDVVQPGAMLLSLVGTELDRVELSLNEQQTGRVALNQSALVSVDAFPDRTFAASVSFIGPRIDPLRAILPVRLRIDDPPDYLKADMTASVQISVAQTTASISLPTSAILYPEPDRPAVLVVRDGRVVQQSITLGLMGDDRVEVLDGLSAEALVVAEPNAIAPGSRAKPQAMLRL